MKRTETQSFPLRISAEEHAALKAYASVTGTSANEIVRRALREFLAGPGRREQFDALVAEAKEQYSVAIDKLADL